MDLRERDTESERDYKERLHNRGSDGRLHAHPHTEMGGALM